jgi:hypothetical protein
MTFRGHKSSHPLDEARAGLRRELSGASGFTPSGELVQAGAGDTDELATSPRV